MTYPWDTEEDKYEWVDKYSGYVCTILRNPVIKNLCGYVDLPKGHSLYGEEYDNISMEVHGGLTYSDSVISTSSWRLGFDAAHFMDLCPYMTESGYPFMRDCTYKDVAYMKEECRSLAEQLYNLDNNSLEI